MSTTYSREALQFEADFAAYYFGLTPEQALTHEAVRMHFLQRQSYKHNFDCDETGEWLRQYLPKNIIERQRIGREVKELRKQIHFDDASYQHYCYEYTQFSKQRRLS